MRVLQINYAVEIQRYDIEASLKAELAKLFERHNMEPLRKRWTDTPASRKTIYRRFVNTCASFERLASLGYRLEYLKNFSEKHVRALVQDMEARQLKASTIQNILSYFRWVAKHVGKPGLVKEGVTYVQNPETLHRTNVATVDKSWSGNHVDPLEILERVRRLDKRVAAQIEMAWALGLRAEESMLIRPWLSLNDALKRGVARIEFGTKGGRPRDVIVDDIVTIDVLARAAMFAPTESATTIAANKTLDQWRNHFYYIARRCQIKRASTDGGLGVTVHGLRHEALQRLFTELTGLPAPVKGQDVEYDRGTYLAAMRAVVEKAGHSDRYKSGAYLGSPRALAKLKEALLKATGSAAGSVRVADETPTSLPGLRLVRPSLEHLPSYRAALELGPAQGAKLTPRQLKELAEIAADSEGFVASQIDLKGQRPPFVLQDGRLAVRLPSITLWLWDGEYCGSINLRWQPGTAMLPATCLGHIGYRVVPAKRRRGYASAALISVLPILKALGLPYVEITAEPDNHASRRVIENAGGVLLGQFEKPAALGGEPAVRYRVALG